MPRQDLNLTNGMWLVSPEGKYGLQVVLHCADGCGADWVSRELEKRGWTFYRRQGTIEVTAQTSVYPLLRQLLLLTCSELAEVILALDHWWERYNLVRPGHGTSPRTKQQAAAAVEVVLDLIGQL